ncbi:MAG: hypothetical protein JO011_13020 [Ktedonobacteraceae bacterium]|nr:hypothetical protein [Ktedonobacteraceae bacterium]MBV9711820.1 hypothetical protein [Ktedonobacteraceae bacterium]
MEDLLAHIPDTDEYYVGSFVHEPSLRELSHLYYSMRIRAIRNKRHRRLQFGNASIVLATGETIPVKVTRIKHLNFGPGPVDKHTLVDNRIGVDASMITPEQIKEVRLFVQRFGPDNTPI